MRSISPKYIKKKLRVEPKPNFARNASHELARFLIAVNILILCHELV